MWDVKNQMPRSRIPGTDGVVSSSMSIGHDASGLRAVSDDQANTIRVALFDDQPLMRLSLREFLQRWPSIDVTHALRSPCDPFTQDVAKQANLVVTDVRFANCDCSGINFADEIKQRSPSTKVIFYSSYDHLPYIQLAQDIGADGYVLKSTSPHTLLLAVQSVFRDSTFYFDPQTAKHIATDSIGRKRDQDRLVNTRQKAILELVAEGLSNEQIASSLNVSLGLVRTDLSKVLESLGASNRTQAVLIAVKQGIIMLSSD